MTCARCNRADARVGAEADDLGWFDRGVLLQRMEHVFVEHRIGNLLLSAAPPAAGRRADGPHFVASPLGHCDEGELARRTAASLFGGAIDDVDGPGEDVAWMDRGRGCGEGHGDAEVRDGGISAVSRRFQCRKSVWADGGGGFEVGDGLGDAADGELRWAMGTLDAGLGGRAEAGVDGEGEVEGGGPAHGELGGADARDDVDDGADGDFERPGGVFGDGGFVLLGPDVVEERDVVVRDAAEGEAQAGFCVEILDGAVGRRQLDAVEERLAVEVGGEVDFQQRHNGRAQGYRAGAGEAYPRVQDGEDLDAELRQRPEAGHEILLPRDGSHSRYTQS